MATSDAITREWQQELGRQQALNDSLRRAAEELRQRQEQQFGSTNTEELRAELIRQQTRERLIAAAEEENAERQEGAGAISQTTKKISIMELVIVLIPAIIIDLTEFFILFIGAIPFIGQPILGAYSALDWILNGCMAGLLLLWMGFHGIWPFSPKGLRISALIGGTLVGESIPLVSTIIPGWTGCALGVFKIANSDKNVAPTPAT